MVHLQSQIKLDSLDVHAHITSDFGILVEVLLEPVMLLFSVEMNDIITSRICTRDLSDL